VATFAAQIQPSFGQLTQLQWLNLLGNQLSALPESFVQLTQLQSLGLGGKECNMMDTKGDM
jgi:Leucine-rich repeat (LRR) protein